MMNEDIREIDMCEFISICFADQPRGKFYHKDRRIIFGVDSTTNGDTTIKKFNNLLDCLDWLNGEIRES